MITDLWLIGIGTGSLAHVTQEGLDAMRNAAIILIPHKGADKDGLAALRYALIAQSGSKAEVIAFDYPQRDPALPYQTRVAAWHDEIARRWQAALPEGCAGPVALLVWGDPSLYDSTMRIAQRLNPAPRLRVVPGITAIQALTAAHAIPLNTIDGAVQITTGRQLRTHGWPDGVDTVLVMLDGEMSFEQIDPTGLHIWWGAQLGGPGQALHAGPLEHAAAAIAQQRAAVRARDGWVMDTYLLRKQA